MQDTLVDNKVVDALDKMTCDGKPEFLNERNLKLEQMRTNARTSLHYGSTVTKFWKLTFSFDGLLTHLWKIIP